MADEDVVEKSPGGWQKIMLLAVAGIVLIAAVVGGTLYFTGFFNPASTETSVEVLEAMGQPPQEMPALDKVEKELTKTQKFEQLYDEMDRKFIVNVKNSKKFVQFSLGIMTHYDQRVIDNIHKHQIPLRSAVLKLTSMLDEESLGSAEGKMRLQETLKAEMNRVLTGYEDFGGIEEVHFTEFVIQ